MCVDRTYPSFRFFARNLAAGKGDLQVEVLWQESGVRRSSKVRSTRRPARRGRRSSRSGSPPARSAPGRLEPVTFRFIAVGGAWQIDDLYVDPFMRR